MDFSAVPMVIFDFITMKLLPFLVVLTLIVFIHELGHYLVARWNKVKVDAFAVGFGPELFGFDDRNGTRWKFCAIPLGGYVKFFGDEDPSSKPDFDKLDSMTEDEREGAFEHKALWRKASVVAAGPIANFILAIVIYTGLFVVYDDVRVAAVVGEVVAESPAEKAGFMPGDKIVELQGSEITSFDQVAETTMLSSGEALNFVVLRGEERVPLTAFPKMTEQTDRFGNSYKVAQVGIRAFSGPENVVVQQLGPIEAFLKALDRTWVVIKGTFNFLGELILGKQDAKELRGPLGIGQITSQVATLGVAQLLSLAGVISISIGLLNLFPVPMLDGGHLVFYAIEAVRGRPMSPRAMEISFRFGLMLVLGLMIFATTNDVSRLFGAG